jgi:hypothetical protein
MARRRRLGSIMIVVPNAGRIGQIGWPGVTVISDQAAAEAEAKPVEVGFSHAAIHLSDAASNGVR